MRADRFRLALVSLLVVAAAYGCAGVPQQRPNRGSAAQNPTQTTRSGILGAPNGTRQTSPNGMMWSRTGVGAGATTDLGRQISSAVANLFGIGDGTGMLRNNAGALGTGDGGAMPGGNAEGFRAGDGGAMLESNGDTANNGGGGAMPGGNANAFEPGDGGAMLGGKTEVRPAMRVSTLVLGDIAYIGIDATTVPGRQQGGAGAGTTANPGAAGTGTTANTGSAGAGATTGTAGAGTATNTGTVGAGTSLEQEVRARVKAMFPQLAEVYVTTDPTMVYRIARVTGDQAGITPQEKVSEMAAIARALTPSAGVAPGS